VVETVEAEMAAVAEQAATAAVGAVKFLSGFTTAAADLA
jgi:hypothetical protein